MRSLNSKSNPAQLCERAYPAAIASVRSSCAIVRTGSATIHFLRTVRTGPAPVRSHRLNLAKSPMKLVCSHRNSVRAHQNSVRAGCLWCGRTKSLRVPASIFYFCANGFLCLCDLTSLLGLKSIFLTCANAQKFRAIAQALVEQISGFFHLFATFILKSS